MPSLASPFLVRSRPHRVVRKGRAASAVQIRRRANHETGSGAWDYVLVNACDGMMSAPAFSEQYLYGAKIELRAPSEFLITHGVWEASDPTYSPSRTVTSRYRWSADRKRFVAASSR